MAATRSPAAHGPKKQLPGLGLAMLAVIALQVGLQPVLSSKFITKDVDKRSIVLSVEVGKILVCAVSLSAAGEWRQGGGVTLRTLAFACLPAAVYLVQNLSMQVAYQKLDAVTFNCLNQTKIGACAVFLFLVMGQGQTPQQLVALVLLSVAAGIVQSPPPSRAGGAPVIEPAEFQKGVMACLLGSMLSGLGATITQMLLQGIGGRNSYQLTMEMALVTVPILVADVSLRPQHAAATGGSLWVALFRGWSLGTLMPVVTQSLGSVVVGMVTKRLGGIAKGFAIVGGLVLTGIYQSIADGQLLPARPLLALVLVLLSTWLHSTYPWTPKRKVDKQEKKEL